MLNEIESDSENLTQAIRAKVQGHLLHIVKLANEYPSLANFTILTI